MPYIDCRLAVFVTVRPTTSHGPVVCDNLLLFFVFCVTPSPPYLSTHDLFERYLKSSGRKRTGEKTKQIIIIVQPRRRDKFTENYDETVWHGFYDYSHARRHPKSIG